VSALWLFNSFGEDGRGNQSGVVGAPVIHYQNLVWLDTLLQYGSIVARIVAPAL